MVNKIVILDNNAITVNPLWWHSLLPLGEVECYGSTAEEDIVERCSGATMVFTNKCPLSGRTLEELPALRFVGVMATGYNIVDVHRASRLGVCVTNVPAYSTASVAQLTIAHLLNVATRMEHFCRATRGGRWSSSGIFSLCDRPVVELQGKWMGIVGFGSIGSAVARIALALGMRVMAFSSKGVDELSAAGVQKAPSLERMLAQCDVVSLHCPLTPQTTHLINERTLRLMKPTAILLNTSRGAVVDENALANALADGTIAAAAIDVMQHEPPESDSPLLKLDNCFVTPHIGWASNEAQQRLIEVLIVNAEAFAAGHPRNVVNDGL